MDTKLLQDVADKRKANAYADAESLRVIAITLSVSPRYGEYRDSPEGVRFIRMSHTLATILSNTLTEIADRINQK